MTLRLVSCHRGRGLPPDNSSVDPRVLDTPKGVDRCIRRRQPVASVEAIEGVGPALAKKLIHAGVRATGALLKEGATLLKDVGANRHRSDDARDVLGCARPRPAAEAARRC